jgi:hypothetical protein
MANLFTEDQDTPMANLHTPMDPHIVHDLMIEITPPKNSPAIFPGLPSISDKGIGIDQGFDQGIVLDQGFDQGFDQGYNQGFDGSGGKKTKTIKKFKNSLKKTRKINRKSN